MAGSINLQTASGGNYVITPEDFTGTKNIILPSSGIGKVINVANRSVDSVFTTASGTTWIVTDNRMQYTPVASGSSFSVTAISALNARNASQNASVKLMWRNVTTSSGWSNFSLDANSTYGHGGFMYASGVADLWGQYTATGVEAVPYTLGQTLEFAIWFAGVGPGGDGSTTSRHGHTACQSSMTIMEIAQ